MLIRVRPPADGPIGAALDDRGAGEDVPIALAAVVVVGALASVLAFLVIKAKLTRPPSGQRPDPCEADEDARSPALRREVIMVDFLTGKTITEWDVVDDCEELDGRRD
jgi:hypothetical protein